MSERLPYEEQLPQQLRDFPLPDEDAAWADMKKRLEEDDDDGVIVWWKKGCAGWGLLLLALITAGWWMLRDKETQKQQSSITNTIPGKINRRADTVAHTPPTATTIPGARHSGKDSTSASEQPDHTVGQTFFIPGRSSSGIRPHATQRPRPSGITTSSPEKTDRPLAIQETPGQTGRPVDPSKISVINEHDSTTQLQVRTFLTGDSVMRPVIDSARTSDKTDTSASKEKKKDSLRKKEIFFSAGLALFQQVPVAGQKAVPYRSQGREFSWTDYIPSLYMRLNKKDKWFIQGEFRYGAPQYTKPLLYFVKPDTALVNKRDTSRRLQKTYYHQLPVSFNYYVASNWSVGAGLIWNKFSKSLYEEAVRNPADVPDSFLSKKVLTTKEPQTQGLSRSYFQGLIETQYQWRKFTFGARYAFGLAPFIRFTLPGEAERKEKNQSLQLFLRYEIFRKPIFR